MRFLQGLIFLTFISCSSNELQQTSSFQISHVAKVKTKKEEKVVYPGEVVKVSDEDAPILVEAPERIPLLIMPSSYYNNQRIELKGIESLELGEKNKDYLNSVVNSTVSKIFEVLELVDKSKTKEALDQIVKLRLGNPEVAYYYFIEASIHHQLGSKEKARETLEKGMTIYQNDPRAQKYYKELGGE